MRKAFSNLPDMCRTHLVGIGTVILNFVVFKPCLTFHYDFHDLVCKTLIGTEGGVALDHLNVRPFIYVHEAPRLGKNIYRTRISNMIDVQRVIYVLTPGYMNKNSSIYKCGIQRIDSIFQILAAVAEPFGYEILEFIFCGFFQSDHTDAFGPDPGKGKRIKTIDEYHFIGLFMSG